MRSVPPDALVVAVVDGTVVDDWDVAKLPPLLHAAATSAISAATAKDPK